MSAPAHTAKAPKLRRKAAVQPKPFSTTVLGRGNYGKVFGLDLFKDRDVHPSDIAKEFIVCRCGSCVGSSSSSSSAETETDDDDGSTSTAHAGGGWGDILDTRRLAVKVLTYRIGESRFLSLRDPAMTRCVVAAYATNPAASPFARIDLAGRRWLATGRRPRGCSRRNVVPITMTMHRYSGTLAQYTKAPKPMRLRKSDVGCTMRSLVLLARRFVAALATFEATGFAHRDIHIHNILVDWDHATGRLQDAAIGDNSLAIDTWIRQRGSGPAVSRAVPTTNKVCVINGCPPEILVTRADPTHGYWVDPHKIDVWCAAECLYFAATGAHLTRLVVEDDEECARSRLGSLFQVLEGIGSTKAALQAYHFRRKARGAPFDFEPHFKGKGLDGDSPALDRMPLAIRGGRRSPTEGYDHFVDLLSKMLRMSPGERVTGTSLVNHPFLVFGEPANSGPRSRPPARPWPARDCPVGAAGGVTRRSSGRSFASP